MMVRILLAIVVGWAMYAPIFSQKVTVRGTVVDKTSGDPLVSAYIAADEVYTAISNFDGAFSLSLEPGTYSLNVQYIGFEHYDSQLDVMPGQDIRLDIRLTPVATILQSATVTAGKYQKPLSEVTVSLDIIDPELVKNTNQTSIEGVLDKLPGVNMLDGQANIRGGSGFSQGTGSRVLLLMNDLPILGADTGIPNWDDLPIEILDKIEVIKGSASALYGASALNGVVHVQTITPGPTPRTEISSFYTNYRRPRDRQKKWWDSDPYEFGGSVMHSRRIGKTDLLLGAFYSDQQSYRKDWFERRGRFNLGLRYRATDRLRIGVNGNFNAGEDSDYFFWAGLDSLNYRGLESSKATGHRQRFTIDPYIHFFQKNGAIHKLIGRFYRTDNNNISGDSDRSSLSSIFHVEYRYQQYWSEQQISLAAGTVFSGSKAVAELFANESFRSRNYSVYAQADKKVGDHLNFSVGIRHDRNHLDGPEEFQGRTLPDGGKVTEDETIFRLGANYGVAEATFLRASWGQGYRFPSIVEKYISTKNGGIPVSPNPDLVSEFGWSAEVGLKQGFKLSEFYGYLDLSAFWSEYDDMIEFNFVDLVRTGFQSRNIGDTRIKGVEVSVTGKGDLLGVPIRLLTGYTYINPRFKHFDTTPAKPGEAPSEGQQNANLSSVDYNVLKYRNKHSFKLDIEADLKRISVGVAALHNSHMEAVDAILEFLAVPGLRQFRQQHDNGYTVYNTRLSYDVFQNVKASFLINNLFNEEYSVRPGLLDAPRNVSFRIDWTIE